MRAASISIVIPVETPAEQWHAQWALTEAPISIKMGQKVDFSCKVTTTAKLPLATFKLCDTGNDDSYLFADMYQNVNGEYVVRYDDATIQGSKAGDMEKVKACYGLRWCSCGCRNNCQRYRFDCEIGFRFYRFI